MNFAPSDLPHLAGAATLSEPSFDIISAVSSTRQSALPAVRAVERRTRYDSHIATLTALRQILSGKAGRVEQNVARPVRFFDLSDNGIASPETMNDLFTRGFQSLLNPSPIKARLSVSPIPHDDETME